MPSFTAPASFDPYHDRKVYHLGAMTDGKGRVSPLCADPPRALNLKRDLWTLRPEAVTMQAVPEADRGPGGR